MSAIEVILETRARDLGSFAVHRLLPSPRRQTVGPFIFFDHMGPAEMSPGQGLDVRPHPHIGLATVTYLFEGEITHRDSLGCVQVIRPGEVNWMTAGRGIVHSERTPSEARRSGARLHGLQLWVVLPRHAEETDPTFFHHPASDLPMLRDDHIKARLIVGSAFGKRAAVSVFSSMFYIDVTLPAGAGFSVPDEHEERAVYVVDGEAEIDGQTGTPRQMLVLVPGAAVTVRAARDSRIVLLGGEKLDAPRYIWWNFVSSSKERMEQARADWQAQRFDKVPGETEFIPLPDS